MCVDSFVDDAFVKSALSENCSCLPPFAISPAKSAVPSHCPFIRSVCPFRCIFMANTADCRCCTASCAFFSTMSAGKFPFCVQESRRKSAQDAERNRFIQNVGSCESVPEFTRFCEVLLLPNVLLCHWVLQPSIQLCGGAMQSHCHGAAVIVWRASGQSKAD